MGLETGMLKMTKALTQLTRILRDGETVDGAQVNWDDNGVLDNLVDSLTALDTNALEEIARDVGVDLREANAAAERLCDQLKSDQGHITNTASRDKDVTTIFGDLCVNDTTVGVSPSASTYAFRGVYGITFLCAEQRTAHCIGSVPNVDYVYFGTSVAEISPACLNNITTASEVLPGPDFSLANHVFGAVWQHLCEGHKQLLDAANEEFHHDQPVVIVVEDLVEEEKMTEMHVPARFGPKYPLSGIDQLVAVSHARKGSRSNRRNRD
jgi:hypothetical protein